MINAALSLPVMFVHSYPALREGGRVVGRDGGYESRRGYHGLHIGALATFRLYQE